MRCDGKIALITGAQQGIGQAMALRFAQEGADIALNYLDDRQAAEAVAAQVRATGTRCMVLQGDVSRPADTRRLVQETQDNLGLIDVLVNNAGVFPRTPFLALTEEHWDFVLGVNLKGTFMCAQLVARALVEAGRPGAIVNISSSAAFRGSPRGAHYSASKAGILGLNRSMALELAPHGIRVNAIAPGLTDTAQPRYGMSEDQVQEASRLVPLGRMCEPEDIAAAAVFLASDDARLITGQVIHVNGGSFLA